MSTPPTTTPAPDSGPDTPAWTVRETRPENHDVTSLFLEPPEGAAIPSWRPGQFATIRLKTPDGWSEPHPFTITCPPIEPGQDACLRMTIKSVDPFTSHIRELAPGAPVLLAGPYGTFLKDVDEHDAVCMIAGGVGVTPFLSALRHFRDTGADNHCVLFWSNKTPEDAFAAGELAGMTATLDLTVVHCFSRATAEQVAAFPASGRVYAHRGRLSRDILDRHTPGPGWGRAWTAVCGPPPMQAAVLDMLESLGVDRDAVQTEAFVF